MWQSGWWSTGCCPEPGRYYPYHPVQRLGRLGVTMTTGRDYGPNAMPLRYPDPDVIVLDPRFAALRQGNTPIQRLWTGALWMEGPAWSAGGRYLVWSDIPNNRQLRWLDEDGHVSVFRSPSGNS